MFGYIKPLKPELLVREYEQYKGVYCSLCWQLGKRYGVLSRLTLSYDCTFLAMLLLARSSRCPGFEQGKCVVNPLKKCVFLKDEQPELVFAAALSVIMAYYKIRDDLHDPGALEKARAFLLWPVAARARKKAARDFPDMERVVADAMRQQAAAERESPLRVDACADPTAQMLSGILSLAAKKDSPEQRVLSQFGYFLGRWVYLMDAADDLPKDLKKGAANPFACACGLTPQSTPEQIAQAQEHCNGALNLTLSQMIAAMNLLDFQHFGSIIRNIVCQGLPEMQKELLFEQEREKDNV